jgi:citrate synthase
MSEQKEKILSQIWEEIPEENDPFVASTCYCSGYDVYGEVLQKASWSDYIYLLFCGERPNEVQSKLLDSLALALANPGPRDHSVRAAMNGGVGGSTSASCLMAALAVGAGELGGAREVFIASQQWQQCGTDLEAWQQVITHPTKNKKADTWPEMEHPAGFDPHGVSCPKPVIQTLNQLCSLANTEALNFLNNNREQLEQSADCPLAMSGVATAALFDLGLNPEQAEMLYLLLRLPGAAVHALEQKHYGWRKYPYFHNGLKLTNDPINNENIVV